MSYIFSRALVEESSAVRCSGIDAFAPSKTTPTHKLSSSPDKTTAPCRHARFGMMFGLSTPESGVELLTSWLAGFRVRTSAWPELEPGSTASEAASGVSSPGSFAKYDRDSSLWKTPQCSLLGDSEEFLATWPRSGSMRNGACWEQTTWAPHIDASASGY